MEEEEFVKAVNTNACVQNLLRVSARGYYGTDVKAGLIEPAFLVLFFPVAKFIVKEIGMPWLVELNRLSDLHVQNLRKWIKNEYKKKGLEDRLAKAGAEFYESLAKTESESEQKLFEALLKPTET